MKDGNLEDVYKRLRGILYEFNRGSPTIQSATIRELKHIHNCFAVLCDLCAEAGTLIDANPGHINNVATLITGPNQARTWP